jgi:hypothetical protein
MLSSCGVGQLVTGKTASERKQERKCNRASKRIAKAVAMCPELMQEPQKVRDTVFVEVLKVEVDTMVLKADTIEVVQDRWRVRIIDRVDSLIIEGGCDSIFVEVPVEVECPPVVGQVKRVNRPLRWWQIALMVLGLVTVWRVIVLTFNTHQNRY